MGIIAYPWEFMRVANTFYFRNLQTLAAFNCTAEDLSKAIQLLAVKHGL